LSREEKVDEKSDRSSDSNISRRDFLKYSVGVAAVTAGSAALMGKVSFPMPKEQAKTPSSNDSLEPIVAAVNGDELTVMSGHVSVKVKDAGLAGLISEKLKAGS
jgi:TAT (twin-arginine translocation) pathway signal sequence